MKTITIKIDNLKITRYTTLSGLNITLARTGHDDGLFTTEEATQLIIFLNTQPIDQAIISDIRCDDAVMIDDETGKTELYSPYQMSFGTGGFKAELRDWCAEYSLDFDVEVFFYEYDDDYKCHRSHLVNTYKRKCQEYLAQTKSSLKKAGYNQNQINDLLEEVRNKIE